MIYLIAFIIFFFTDFIFVPIIIHFEVKFNPDLFYALHKKDIERSLKKYE